MTTSSQTPPGALPPETPPTQPPMPLGEALAAPSDVKAEQATPVTTVQAATGIIRGAMDRGIVEPGELAQAEEDAGLLFDPERAEDIARAALDQARAEYEAKLDELREEEPGAYFKLRYDRLQTLLAGHPDTHLMSVGEILAAVDGRDPRAGAPLVVEWGGLVMGPSGDTDDNENTVVPCTTKLGGPAALVLTTRQRAQLAHLLLADPAGAPLDLTWTRSATTPEATDPVKRVAVQCVSSYGGRAQLVVEGDDRQALASLLDAELVRDIHAPCPHSSQCGTAEDLDPSDPALFGWTRVEVAGVEGGPRWYCTPPCVSNAMARAGEELAAIEERADDLIAVDQAEHPGEYGGEL